MPLLAFLEGVTGSSEISFQAWVTSAIFRLVLIITPRPSWASRKTYIALSSSNSVGACCYPSFHFEIFSFCKILCNKTAHFYTLKIDISYLDLFIIVNINSLDTHV